MGQRLCADEGRVAASEFWLLRRRILSPATAEILSDWEQILALAVLRQLSLVICHTGVEDDPPVA